MPQTQKTTYECFCGWCGNETVQTCPDCGESQSYLKSARQPKLGLSGDPVIDANARMLVERSQVGQVKYGTTLDASPATILERLQHLREELADGLNYVTWAIDALEDQPHPDPA